MIHRTKPEHAAVHESGWFVLPDGDLPGEGLPPVLGAGKAHQHGAPAGRAYLRGWWAEHLQWYAENRRGAGWVQQGSTSGTGPHSDGIFDYATLTVLQRRRADGRLEVTCLPLVDTSASATGVPCIFARLTHVDALAVAEREGAELWHYETFDLVRLCGAAVIIEPYTISPHTQQLVGSIQHDAAVWSRLTAAAWPDIVPDPPDTIPASPPSAIGRTLGDAVLARALLDVGFRESPPNDGPRLREMAKHYGATTPLNSCALGVSTWIREGAADVGVDMPIAGSVGAQMLAHQLRAVGLFVEAANVTAADVRPGCVVVWDRSDPTRPETSWWGHTGIVVSCDWQARTFVAVEMNGGPRGDGCYEVEGRRLDDPRLIGFGQLDDVPVQDDWGVPIVPLAPDDEPVHEGSDPLDPANVNEQTRLYAQWLGLPYLADSVSGYDPEPVIARDCTGIDISVWNRPDLMDWDVVGDRHQFAIVRATNGVKPDRHFPEHFNGAADAGLRVGAYHFVSDSQPWREQHDAFMLAMDGSILPALDIEKDGKTDWAKLADVSEHMADAIIAEFGGVIVYTSPSVHQLLGFPEWFDADNVHLWISDYSAEPGKPRWGRGWGQGELAGDRCAIHQWSGSYRGPEFGAGKLPLDINVAHRLPLI